MSFFLVVEACVLADRVDDGVEAVEFGGGDGLCEFLGQRG